MERSLKTPTAENADQKILRLRVETVRGNLQGVKDALDQGLSVDQPFRSGEWNALMHASSLGHQHIVQYLLEKGADPNYHKELFTPLMAACASNTECEEKLLYCVKHLLRYNADLNAMERHRLTPLMFACKQGHVKIVQELIGNNVKLNAQDSQGWTALFWAVTKNKIEIVELLVAAGANKEERDRSGGTALLLATRKGHHEIEEILRFGIRRTHILDTTPDSSGLRRTHILDTTSDSSGCPTEDDNSFYSNSTDRNEDIQTVISNQLNKEISKYISFHHDDDMKKLDLKHSWPSRETEDLMKEFQCKQWIKSGVEESDSLSYMAAMKLLAELLIKISHIHSAVAFIRCKFQNSPIDVPKDNRWASSARLRCITRLAYFRAEQLYMETKFLHEYLIKLENHEMTTSQLKEEEEEDSEPIHTVAIADCNDDATESDSTRSVLTTVVIVSACIIVMMWNTKTIKSFTFFNF